MSDFATGKDVLIQELLQERDELFQKLSRLRKVDNGALEELESKNQELELVVAQKDQQIHKLTDQLAWFRHKFFGKSSEKHIAEDPNQRKIDWDGLDVLPEEQTAIKDAEKELIEYERRKPEREKKKAVRQPLPDHLRREIEVIEPEGVQDNWVRIGEEVTEILEHKPGEIYVRRIERPKYAVKQSAGEENITNEQDREEIPAIRIASMPLLPLPRSNAGPSLLAELMMNKYFYHLPFHRQIAILKMVGVRLPASTVNGWFQGSSDLLRALYLRLKELIQQQLRFRPGRPFATPLEKIQQLPAFFRKLQLIPTNSKRFQQNLENSKSRAGIPGLKENSVYVADRMLTKYSPAPL